MGEDEVAVVIMGEAVVDVVGEEADVAADVAEEEEEGAVAVAVAEAGEEIVLTFSSFASSFFLCFFF